MAKLKGKGTTLKQYITSAYVAVAQVLSISQSGLQSETYEADTLDNTDYGIPYEPTGRVEGGSFDFELLFDPALAGHQALLDVIEVPISPTASTKTAFQVVFSDAAATTWSFLCAGATAGMNAVLNDGLKANFTLKVNKIPTYP